MRNGKDQKILYQHFYIHKCIKIILIINNNFQYNINGVHYKPRYFFYYLYTFERE
jgi:hypothetical protein